MQFRIFVQDVGPYGYSGYTDVSAADPKEALAAIGEGKGQGKRRRPLFIALPKSRKDLWPDGKTGRVPQESLRYC